MCSALPMLRAVKDADEFERIAGAGAAGLDEGRELFSRANTVLVSHAASVSEYVRPAPAMDEKR
jgi:hypothetical protein